MTKKEIIEKYGIERYKQYRISNKLKRQNNRLIGLISNYRLFDKKHFNTNEKTITIEQLNTLIKNGCYWCGEKDFTKLGADRLDNNKPHTLENCVCGCLNCNRKREHKELSKPVLQFTLNGTFITEYPSIREAERQTGVNSASISLCCNNKMYNNCLITSAGGYLWRFKTDIVYK